MDESISKQKINFCIVGAQKAGSSSLAAYMGQTPALFMPKYEKSIFESPFFENGAVDNFFNDVRMIAEGRKIGIKRPDYLMDKRVPKRLYEHNNQIKIIIVLRNRVKRFISAAYWYMQVGEISVCDINALISNICTRDYNELSDKERELLEYGKYADGLRRYVDEIGADNIMMLDDKYFYSNASEVHSLVCQHLGLDGAIEAVSPEKLKKVKSAVYSKSRLKYLACINKNLFYKPRIANSLSEVRPIGFRIIYYLFKSIDVFIFSRLFANEAPEISMESRNKLIEYYRDDVKNLNALVSCHADLKFHGRLPPV